MTPHPLTLTIAEIAERGGIPAGVVGIRWQDGWTECSAYIEANRGNYDELEAPGEVLTEVPPGSTVCDSCLDAAAWLADGELMIVAQPVPPTCGWADR